jgi:hypothetical protein
MRYSQKQQRRRNMRKKISLKMISIRIFKSKKRSSLKYLNFPLGNSM